METVLVFSVGLLGQILFSARMIVQWIHSERAGRVTSPLVFWKLSLTGSLFFMLYGVLRNDLVILIGQFIPYGIYLRNLQFKKKISGLSGWFVWLMLSALPVLFLFFNRVDNYLPVKNNTVYSPIIFWGLSGQIIFTLRFAYQWYQAEKVKQSILTTGFWLISLAGALMILSYGIIRKDFVLILAHGAGSIIYCRNLMLIKGNRTLPMPTSET